MKKKDRLYLRKDRGIKNYLSFVYIFMIEHSFNIIEKLAPSNIKSN